MATTYYDDYDDLEKAVSAAVSCVLEDYVAPVAEAILLKHIKTDIYDASTSRGHPKPNAWVKGSTYQRRHVLEGGITSTLEGKDHDSLMVTSDAVAGQSVVKGYEFTNRYAGSFLQLLESGHMGIWRGGFARPAVSNAQKEIDRSSYITNAIKTGLEREMEE